MAARRRVLAALLALALPLAVPACVQSDGRRFNPLRKMTELTVAEERKLGHAFDGEIARHLAFIDDPVVLGFLSDLGQDIVHYIEPQPFLYRFRVVLDPSLNAFAVPGGYVYFHSGTLLAAGSLDELAGVMGHEIAHVKDRHYARMRKQAAIPDLLINLGAIAATIATQEPAAAIAAQGANVALKLKWSRELEADADRLGAIFMTRAGYDPAGITRFFERILLEQSRHPTRLPPYLYSHPDVENRIATVRDAAEKLRRVTWHDAALDEAFRDAQARLALLVASNRTTWPSVSASNRAATAALLDRARSVSEANDGDAALAPLAQAAALDPTDPEIPFRQAEIYERSARHQEAIDAYRRTLRLDPTRALVHYRLGLAYKPGGDRQRATFYLEQAARRFGDASTRRKAAEWEIEKLTFPVLVDAWLARGETSEQESGHTGADPEFHSQEVRAIWWARLGPHFARAASKIRVRWKDPSGAIHQESPPESRGGQRVNAVLEIRGAAAAHPGRWTVEALLDDDVIDRRTFTILP